MRRRGMRSMRRRRAPMYRSPTLRRQAFGNFASAMQQRDSTNVVIQLQEDIVIDIPSGSNEATLVRNATALMCKSPFFQNYVGMYDQFKLNAVRASLEVTSLGTGISSANSFSSVCTSWDRNGVQIRRIPVDEEVQGVVTTNYYWSLPSYEQVASYSSANEKTIYYGSRWGVIRQLDASSMQEKSIYLPTQNTRDVLTYGNALQQWNPCLLIAIKSPITVSGNVSQSAVFSIHWQFDVTLRGLRKISAGVDTNTFLPDASFIGYAPNNYGLAINTGSGPKVAGSNITAVSAPTINPIKRVTINYANDGTAAENPGTV